MGYLTLSLSPSLSFSHLLSLFLSPSSRSLFLFLPLSLQFLLNIPDLLSASNPLISAFLSIPLQIFNLMKFDSYTRFLKSLLYQECMLAEVEGRPLPDPYHVPRSPTPTSRHSTGSDRSNLSTPKKVTPSPSTSTSVPDGEIMDGGMDTDGLIHPCKHTDRASLSVSVTQIHTHTHTPAALTCGGYFRDRKDGLYKKTR